MANTHLSYPAFSFFYGDLGITYWTKYNWLDNDYVGKYNVWNEEYELGYITNGQNVSGSGDIRSKDYIECYPGKLYYISSPVATVFAFYDEDKTWISPQVTINNNYFTTPDNCYYMRFYAVGQTSYNGDIRIYEVVKNIKSVAINSLNWSYDAVSRRFYADISDIATVADVRTTQMYCKGYECLWHGEAFNPDWNMVIYGTANSHTIYMHNHDYDVPTDFKDGNKGNYIYYIAE